MRITNFTHLEADNKATARHAEKEERMPEVEWNQGLSVGVARCDTDHKGLVEIINDLYAAMKSGSGRMIIGDIVAKLADYTRSHFRGEEDLMAKALYPELAAHRAEHANFVHAVEKFQADLAAGAVGQTIEVAEFLKDWLINHIQRTDKLYTAHLNRVGIR